MDQARVSLVRAEEYDPNELKHKVKHAIDLLGGIENFVPHGSRVFVKVNLLPPPSPPERAIITHPLFTEAVVSLLRDVTPHITIGDDVHDPQSFAVSGYREVCARLGVGLLNLRERGFAETRVDGVVLKKVYIAKAVLEADVIVNLPKLKTHSLTLFTGAVKNFYGIIPAGLRTALHGEHPKPEEFSQVLVDIFSVARPALTVMDAVVAMEGAGPANGDPRKVGLVIAGGDAVAVDAIAQLIVGLDPMGVWTTRHAHLRGLGVGDPGRIEVLGEEISSVRVRDFALPPAAGEVVGRFPRVLTRWATRHLQARPVVVPERCVGCGACVRACPTGAASLDGRRARIDRKRCVRCMCCHEACRYNAIELHTDRVGRHFRSLEAALQRRRRQSSPDAG